MYSPFNRILRSTSLRDKKRSIENFQRAHRAARRGVQTKPPESNTLDRALMGTFNTSADSSSGISSTLGSGKAVVKRVKKKRATDNTESINSNTNIINSEDPIMLEPLPASKFVITLPRPNGHAVAFNIKTLVNYITSSGDFCDPITRVPYSDEQLQAIDEKAKSVNINCNLRSLKIEGKKHFEELKFRRNGLAGLERLAGSLISNMLSICEDDNYDFEDAESEIFTHEMPVFADYFIQIRNEDSQFASQSMEHWISFLKGPPNRPNKNKRGILTMLCGYLQSL